MSIKFPSEKLFLICHKHWYKQVTQQEIIMKFVFRCFVWLKTSVICYYEKHRHAQTPCPPYQSIIFSEHEVISNSVFILCTGFILKIMKNHQF